MSHTLKTYLLLVLVFFVLCLAGFVDYWQTVQIQKLRLQAEKQEARIDRLADALRMNSGEKLNK